MSSFGKDVPYPAPVSEEVGEYMRDLSERAFARIHMDTLRTSTTVRQIQSHLYAAFAQIALDLSEGVDAELPFIGRICSDPQEPFPKRTPRGQLWGRWYQ